MQARTWAIFTAVPVLVATCSLIALAQTNWVPAKGAMLPWGQPSDMVAWEVFVQVTAPAGNPQVKNVEFETWASDDDVYTTSPPTWPKAGVTKQLRASALGETHLRRGVRPLAITPDQCVQKYNKQAAAAAGFPADGCIGEEVRRNWASFQYIVANGLYSIAGLKSAFASPLKVDLPADAIEVKADWVRLSDAAAWYHLTEKQVRDSFYTNVGTSGAVTGEFALVAFHFSSKQIKNWVWSDFEHQLNPGRCDDTGCHDQFGAAVADVEPKATPNQQYGECKKSAAVQAMFTNGGTDAVWQNYCLKGSQIDFVQDGKNVILGNSVIERINAGVPVLQSSCITCHAYASFDNTGNSGGPPDPPQVGPVNQQLLNGLKTNDFIWGNLAAH